MCKIYLFVFTALTIIPRAAGPPPMIRTSTDLDPVGI